MAALLSVLEVDKPFAAFNGGSILGWDGEVLERLLLPHEAARVALALFDAPVDDDSQDTVQERLAAKITSLALLNRTNALILDRVPELGLRDLDVPARAEPAAGPGNDHDFRAGIAVNLWQKLNEGLVHRRVDGVEPSGPVQRHEMQVSVPAYQHRAIRNVVH